ncbi:MerR family transcriptional regulator [Arthrobacter sp. PAMC25284]|nr:MerR family transcriptional regulator [Arthrobacter sp. PAMC25284]
MAEQTGGSTLHIGELADKTGLSLRTIRHYDDVGLLPATSRTEGGFRLYSDADVESLLLIKQMKPLGFSLEEMAEILALIAAEAGREGVGADASPNSARLGDFLEQAVQQRAKMARNLAQADDFIDMLGVRARGTAA